MAMLIDLSDYRVETINQPRKEALKVARKKDGAHFLIPLGESEAPMEILWAHLHNPASAKKLAQAFIDQVNGDWPEEELWKSAARQ